MLVFSFGASVTLPSAEVVGALERGVVSGAMLAPVTCQDLKIWDLGVKHGVQYELAFAFAANAIINQAAYNRLAPDLQKTVLDVGKEVEKSMIRYFKEDEANVIADLKAHGVTFYTLPEDEAKRWREATVAKAGPAFLGIKGIDKGIAQQFVDLLGKKW
jgi:TRAP-type C4-dicarboxylate transport system substrate-binding protein